MTMSLLRQDADTRLTLASCMPLPVNHSGCHNTDCHYQNMGMLTVAINESNDTELLVHVIKLARPSIKPRMAMMAGTELDKRGATMPAVFLVMAGSYR